MLPDGSEATYETNRDYKEFIGEVVRIEYDNNIAKLSTVKTNVISGEFDKKTPSLDGHWLANNCQILELIESSQSGATVRKIELSDIETTTLNSQQVIHAHISGAMDDITFLYLKNVTKIDSTFGVVTQVPYVSDDRSTRRDYYTILAGTQENNVKTAISLTKGDAVEIVKSSSGQGVQKLLQVGSGTEVEGYVEGRIRVDGRNYLVSDYVKVYGTEGIVPLNYEYVSMSLSQIIRNSNVARVTLYSDKEASNGGVVRVIVVTMK